MPLPAAPLCNARRGEREVSVSRAGRAAWLQKASCILRPPHRGPQLLRQHIERVASPDMRSRPAKMGQDFSIRAAGFFKCVRKDRHEAEVTIGIDGLRHPDYRAVMPSQAGRVNKNAAERIAVHAPGKGALILAFFSRAFVAQSEFPGEADYGAGGVVGSKEKDRRYNITPRFIIAAGSIHVKLAYGGFAFCELLTELDGFKG